MKTILLILAVAVIAAGGGGWYAARRTAAPAKPQHERKILYYQSPMHPWIKSDQPGNCTICGMKLVPVYEGEKGFDTSEGALTLSSNVINVIHVAAEGTNGNFAIVADAHAGLLAPDIRPPRAGWQGTQDGTAFSQSLRARGVRGGAQDLDDVVGGQQGRQAFLPVVVAAFDFAFGLGRGGVAQRDAIEVQCAAQLGESVGRVGEEEGMVVHVECQRQSVDLEGAGQKVQVGQERFTGIETGAGVVTGGVIQEVEQNLFVRRVGQESVGCGVVLPESAIVANLPAFDGFGRGLEAGVGGQMVFDRPAPDAGAVGFEVEAAVQFAGGGAVRGGVW